LRSFFAPLPSPPLPSPPLPSPPSPLPSPPFPLASPPLSPLPGREYRKLSVRPRRDGRQEKLVVKTHFSVTRRRAGKTPAETVKVPLLRLFAQVVAAGGLAVLGTELEPWKRVYGACVGETARSPGHPARVMNSLRAMFEGFEQDAAAQR
jgi:hypothetical protein